MFNDYVYACKKRTNNPTPYLVIFPGFTNLHPNDIIYAEDDKHTMELYVLSSYTAGDDETELIKMFVSGTINPIMHGTAFARVEKVVRKENKDAETA